MNRVLGVAFLIGAVLAARKARTCWLAPLMDLDSPSPWLLYSPRRWANSIRAMAWGFSAFATMMLSVALVKVEPSLAAIAKTVFFIGCAQIWIWVFATIFGRPRFLLTRRF